MTPDASKDKSGRRSIKKIREPQVDVFPNTPDLREIACHCWSGRTFWGDRLPVLIGEQVGMTDTDLLTHPASPKLACLDQPAHRARTHEPALSDLFWCPKAFKSWSRFLAGTFGRAWGGAHRSSPCCVGSRPDAAGLLRLSSAAMRARALTRASRAVVRASLPCSGRQGVCRFSPLRSFPLWPVLPTPEHPCLIRSETVSRRAALLTGSNQLRLRDGALK
jgi:hypothetical protein